MQPGSLTPPNQEEMPTVTASISVSKASNFSDFSMAWNTSCNFDIYSFQVAKKHLRADAPGDFTLGSIEAI
jgi:hypothetical protein